MTNHDDNFTIRFWGVRGSIASPGPSTQLVGGNTSCVEVRCGDTTLILDAGTPSAILFSAPRDLTLAELERRYVKGVLEACAGNKTKAAEQLGVARNTLTRLLGKDKA